MIPGQCRFEVDIRGKTLAVLDEALDQVKAIAAQSFLKGTAATVRILSRRPPMEHTAATDRLFEKVCAVSKRYGLEEVKPKEKGGGSDSAYLIPLGIPTLCSFGPTGTGEHTVAEQACIPSLRGRAKLLAGSIWVAAPLHMPLLESGPHGSASPAPSPAGCRDRPATAAEAGSAAPPRDSGCAAAAPFSCTERGAGRADRNSDPRGNGSPARP